MKKRAEDLGIKSLLVMCDDEGGLGDPDRRGRAQAVRKHHKWVGGEQTGTLRKRRTPWISSY